MCVVGGRKSQNKGIIKGALLYFVSRFAQNVAFASLGLFMFICMLERKNDQTKASKNKSNMWQHKAKRHSLKPQRSPLYNCQPDKESFQEGCQIALQIK